MSATPTRAQPISRPSGAPAQPDAPGVSEGSNGRPLVLAIAGSLREGSYNRALLRAAAELASEDLEVRIYEGLGEVPPFDEDAERTPAAAVVDFRRRIGEADAVLVATPEYNNSVPGVLKNALDWASRPYRAGALVGKPIAVIGASSGRSGAAQAQEDLRRVLRACGADVLDAGLELTRAEGRFDEAGRLSDEGARATLSGIVRQIVSTAGAAAS